MCFVCNLDIRPRIQLYKLLCNRLPENIKITPASWCSNTWDLLSKHSQMVSFCPCETDQHMREYCRSKHINMLQQLSMHQAIWSMVKWTTMRSLPTTHDHRSSHPGPSNTLYINTPIQPLGNFGPVNLPELDPRKRKKAEHAPLNWTLPLHLKRSH